MTTRRDFLATPGAATVDAASWSTAVGAGGLTTENPARFRFGCHTMTWGDDYLAGLADIAKAGFKIGPDKEAETLALHEANARFVGAAGSQHLQVTDERPKDRAPTADDRKRMGDLLTRLGERTAAYGVELVYHNHMGNLGQRADEVAAGGERSRGGRLSPRHGTLRTGGGRPCAGCPGAPFAADALPGTFGALREVGFAGWVILELDAVPDQGGSATASMLAGKQYIEQVLRLPL